MENPKRKEKNDELIRNMEIIYEETVVTIRMNQGMSREFKIKKEVRQRCVLSPLLFNLYMVEIDEALENRKIGEIEVGRNRDIESCVCE